jgi:hypothetical protein
VLQACLKSGDRRRGLNRHRFEVIGKLLQDPAILAENVYNINETRVMLFMPSSIKVLVGKDDR